MARRKAAATTAEEAETTEETTEVTAEETTEVTTEETTEEATEETIEEATDETTEDDDTVIQRAYIGPSIPKANLFNGGITKGTKSEVTAYIVAVAEKYPKAKYLFVSPDNLATAKKKVRTKGNLLNKYYNDILEQVRSR